MIIGLWTVQGLLALMFGYSGSKKLLRSNDQIRALPWARDLSVRFVRRIGVLEGAAALGMVLPTLTGILPWLTPLAAAGLVLLMLGAARINMQLKLFPAFATNLLLLALAAFVVYGRGLSMFE